MQKKLESPNHKVALTEYRAFWMAFGVSLSDIHDLDICAGDNLDLVKLGGDGL